MTFPLENSGMDMHDEEVACHSVSSDNKEGKVALDAALALLPSLTKLGDDGIIVRMTVNVLHGVENPSGQPLPYPCPTLLEGGHEWQVRQ